MFVLCIMMNNFRIFDLGEGRRVHVLLSTVEQDKDQTAMFYNRPLSS